MKDERACGNRSACGVVSGIATLRELLGRGRRARTPIPGCIIGFADGLTGISHSVTEEAFAVGRRERGRYVAVCGAQVLPARLTVPARYHCPACERGV
ncbi:MAG: hypothetical protein JO364_20080 [Pseudonocardiales bacterium]|nr:hypothetical protein [Pseudonocardiales bacterium]MBV9032555.1 hypothetical protein [Pseudonocardiales bacterium]